MGILQNSKQKEPGETRSQLKITTNFNITLTGIPQSVAMPA